MKIISRKYSIVVILVMLTKPVYALDAGALIPYMTQLIQSSVKQLSEFTKMTKNAIQTVNTLKELTSFENFMKEGLDAFVNSDTYGDIIADSYEFYDGLSSGEIQHSFDEIFGDGGQSLYEEEGIDFESALRSSIARRRVNQILMFKAEKMEEESSSLFSTLDEKMKDIRNGSEKGLLKMLAEQAAVNNKLIVKQNDALASSNKQQAIADAEDQKQKVEAAQANAFVENFMDNATVPNVLIEKWTVGSDRNKKPRILN